MDETNSRKHIFVCYSHDDAEVVLSDVAWLRSLSLAAWHDERIHGGVTWADEVAEAIDRSAALLFFVSRHSMTSVHCLNEIAYAVDASKPIIAVFLESVEVTGGLKLFIGRTQAIVRDRLSIDEYRQQVRQAVTMHLRDEAPEDAPRPSPHFWRVPLRRNIGFTGRASLLGELSRSFATHGDVPLVLVGLPGVGKSQAALEFVYRNEGNYRVVAWLRAEEISTLNADYIQLASGINAKGANDPDPRVVVDAVKAWLATHEHWLLVLDNAEDPSVIASYLPERLSGHVLITSKRQNWGRWARRLNIDAFDESEAVEFICARTGTTNREDAAALATALGRLPLALEEAAAYIEATGRTLTSYLQLFRNHHDVLLSRMSTSDGYPHTLRTAFEVSLRQVEAEEPNAAQLLRMLSFVAPDDIPNTLWEPHFARGTESGTFVVDQCLAALRRFSLVTAQADSTSLHRLVQLVSRDRMSPAERNDALSFVLVLIERSFPHVKDMGQQGAECHRYLPHAMSALSHAEELGRSEAEGNASKTSAATLAAGALWGRTGTFLSAYNASLEAESHLEKAYRIFRNDSAHRRLFARTSEMYARVLYNNGHLQRAQEVYADAVASYQSTEGENTIRLMQVHLDLAWVHWTAGDLTQALGEADRCLEVLRSVAGDNDPRAVAGHSIRARIFFEQGQVAAARNEVEKSIAAIEALSGFRMPLMCAVFLQMAQVLQDLGLPLRALSWAQEGLNLGKNAFSEHHTLIAATRCVLGQSLATLGELDAAKAEFETVLESVRRSACPLNQHIGIASAYLCLVTLDLGDVAAARGYLADTERIARQHVAGDRTVINTYLAMARARLAGTLGERDRAARDLDDADAWLSRRFTSDHLYWLPLLRERALEQRLAGELDQARATHERAIEIGNASGLTRHVVIGDHLLGLAEVAAERGDVQQSLQFRQRARDVYRECLGPSNKRVLALT